MIGLVKVAPGDPRLELREVELRERRRRTRSWCACGTPVSAAPTCTSAMTTSPPILRWSWATSSRGTVVELGSSVDERWLGARVVCEPHARACHVCYLCRRGHPEICAQKRSPGWGIHGGFASHVVVPAWLLHRVPESVPDEVAVLAEPMAVTMTALRRGGLAAGDDVLVIGPGPVGLLAALAARVAGAADVVVAGRGDGPRSATARRLGFATTDSAEAAEYVRERTDGRGADLVLEATGTAAGVDAAFDGSPSTGPHRGCRTLRDPLHRGALGLRDHARC